MEKTIFVIKIFRFIKSFTSLSMKKKYTLIHPKNSIVKSVFNLNTVLAFLLFLFGMLSSFGQSPYVDNSPGASSFTVPAGVTAITVELWGAGGAGGGSTNNNDGGSGGGAGGYSSRAFTGLTSGQIINYTTGTGGTGSTGDGGAGTLSTITLAGFTLTTNGGTGGARNRGSIGTGGTASGGTTNTIGGNGTLGTATGNKGGDAPSGGTGGAGGVTNNVGNPGNTPGGGGGGGEDTNAWFFSDREGGNGGNGGIRITFTCPVLTSNAGSNQTLATCGTTATLSANTPVNSTGIWTVVSGTGTVTTPTSPTSGVTGIVPGTPLVLRWTVSNGSCGSTFSDVTITSPTGPGCLSYCIAGGSDPAAGSISNVKFNTIDRFSGFDGYINTGLTTTVTKTIAYNLSVSKNILDTYTTFTQVWIDWNQDGDFADAGEIVMPSASNFVAGITTRTVSVTIPAGATTGNTRMRVMMKYNTAPNANGCDTSTIYMDVEDFYINIQPIAACVAPNTQPTALVLTPSGTTIGGSFAPAIPNPNNYLVVINTTGIAPPAPANLTTYVIGGTLGAGNIIVDNDANTSFVATGLSTTTPYYFFIYSFNSVCTGGPLYNSTAPLTGNTTTTTADPIYCTPSVGVGYESLTYFSNISFVGTLNDISNSSSYSTAPRGYQDFSSIANRSRQAQGQGINISTQTSNRGYLKAWVDWNRDGDFNDSGENVYNVGGIASYSTTFGFIIPAAQPLGNYRVRIRINKDDNITPYDPGAISTFNSCQNIDYYGETEDYTFTVIASCSAVITGTTEGITCGTGTVNLAVTSSGGVSQYRWYATELGGTPIATTTTGSWTTPSISTTTTYWVTGFNGCESLIRTKVTARVNPVATITFTPSIPEVCGENNVLSLTAAGDVQQTFLVDEKFNAGLGVMSNANIVSNGGTTDGLTAWQNHSSTFVPAQQVWFPAIASGMNGNNFALSTSDVGSVITHNAILSPTVSTITYLDLTLSFDIFYSRYYIDNSEPTLDYVTVDVSINGGTSWTEIDRYLTDIGYGTRFGKKTYNLNAYINQPNFRVRVRYYAEWCDGLAIDNFQLYGNVPLNTSFDWTATTPVAAFTDAACLTSYTTGTPITTVYIKPTLAQLEDLTYGFTATATLSNGCSVSQAISINNKSKIWKGGANSDWNNANNWLPLGVPDATNCVIIPPAPNTSLLGGTNYNGFGKTLQVINGGNLRINPTNTVTITDLVEVRGGTSLFNIENSGSLIQINNVANIGNISMKRNTNIKKLDYVYWSTPVANFASSAISPLTSTNLIYKWEPTTSTGFASNFGNWVNGNETMINGKGYIVRGPNNFLATPQIYTANFIGVPNNGIITTPISRSNYTSGTYTTGPTSTPVTNDDDNWNLVGNPYPSAINADAFLNTNSTKIASWIEIWTHGTAPSTAIADPFYQDFGYNYTVSDYLRYNALGGTQFGFDGKIGAGQSFMVLMKDAAITPNTLEFNNGMRSNTYRNDQFYRTTESISVEKHRIWLQLISPQGLESKSLVGYATEATNAYDPMFDADNSGVKTTFELYSVLDTKGLSIQGRALPFDDNDQVSLGVTIPQNGNYIIAIAAVDGLFTSNNQDIYLEDQLLNITHNLRVNPYSFSATTGKYENRFILKYTNSTLSTTDFTANEIKVYTNESINVIATNQTIKSVRVYDILGRVLGNFNNINVTTFSTTTIAKTQTALLVEVTLENGVRQSYKVIF